MRSTRHSHLPGQLILLVRRLWPLQLALGLGIALGGCSNDTTPTVYVDLSYQLRCLDCEPRAPDDAGRVIKVVNGEDGYKLECSVKRIEGVRRVDFSVEFSDSEHASSNHLFKVTSGNLDAEESELRCEVKIVEGANSYLGACSSAAPDPEAGPCQATFDVKDGVISGGVYCTAIPNTANLSTTRYVVSPNSRTEAAKFEIHGCEGL